MAKRHKHKKKHRNNGGGARALPPPAPKRRNRRNGRADKPDFAQIASAIAGGLGGAAIGGYAARKGYDPRWVGAGLAGLGGLGAYKLGGNLRSASFGFAAAATGQSLLEWLDKDEEKKAKNDNEGKGKNGKAQAKDDGAAQPAGANGQPELTYVADKPAPSRNSARGLDRAFNRVRDRLHRIYDDDQDDDRFVEEEDAA